MDCTSLYEKLKTNFNKLYNACSCGVICVILRCVQLSYEHCKFVDLIRCSYPEELKVAKCLCSKNVLTSCSVQCFTGKTVH